MITLENEHLTIQINEKGAELVSVVDRQSGYEFIWQANPEYWGRHAPNLFPIVGRLKNDQYQYKGHFYEMTQHGFARDSVFEVVDTTTKSALLKLESTDKTKEQYPFDFELYIQYTLKEKRVVTRYKVVNKAKDKEMYYAIGGHPAFNVSQKMNEKGEGEFDQIFLEIQPETEIIHYPLSEDGLIKAQAADKKMAETTPLFHETFHNDALVYKIGEERTIKLKDQAKGVEITVQASNLPYVGIWSPYPKRASFVCIEPWAGIADAADTDGDFTKKIGINILEPSQEMYHEYCMLFTKENK